MIYELICDELYIPMKLKEIASLLQVPKEERVDLKLVLDELLKEGKIEVSKKGKFSKAEGKYLIGTYTGHQKGYGFVTVEGMEEDIFIPENASMGALHKDTVQVVLTQENTGKRKEGAIAKVISRGITEVVGTFKVKISDSW